ncbi:MAG TPA: class I tRNA ligase family protein, partial [Candidatus Krumholzibacterium sp.]|nr:class I tRNA ligase family protein [Candidatus Krumholzibacterium sp.]
IFGPDGLRYLLLREVPFDKDGDISIEIMINRYNADLANELGNLFSRTVAMIAKYLGGDIPEAPFDERCDLYGPLKEAVEGYIGSMEKMEFSRALGAYWTVVQRANQYIEEKAPWAVAKDESRKSELEAIFRELLAVLRTSAIVLSPFMPGKMAEMARQLTGVPESLEDLPPAVSGAKGLDQPVPLFPRMQVDPDKVFEA